MELDDKNLTRGTTPEQPPAESGPVGDVTPDFGAVTPPAEDHSPAGGKRLAPSGKKGRSGAVAAVVIALLAAAYLGVCAYANTAKTALPNTHVAGVDISGMSWEGIPQALEQGITTRLEGLSVDFLCQGKTYSVPGTDFSLHTEEVVSSLKQRQSGSFLLGGVRLMAAMLGTGKETVALTLDTMPQEVLRAVEECSDKDAVTDYTITDTQVIFTKGRTGRTLDVAGLLTALEEQAGKKLAGEEAAAVEAAVSQMPPAEPNFEAIRREVYAQVSEASIDPETCEIIPSVTGKDLDIETARAALEWTAEGQKCPVNLTLTQPQVSTESLNALLFRDVLGEAVTYVYGSVARRTNVRLSAEFANERILMPGDVFSYANDCGPFTTDRGFMAAAGYLGGKTVDMEGGGVCQTASTIYLAVLRSGLEVVERHPHGYEPAYVPGGLDATVAGTVLDFRFSNDTEYPVKIVTELDKKYNLTVTILGTNLTGTHWEPYSTNRVITQYAETVYEPNEAIPQGTTEKDKERTAYNGVSIDSYNREVDADGNVLQEIFLYRTKYKVRDAVIWYNPADAELWGIDPETGKQTEPPASEEPAPGESGGPVDPNVTPDPAGSEESPPPAETDPGEVPELPDIPVIPTQAPEESFPAAASEPQDTQEPPASPDQPVG